MNEYESIRRRENSRPEKIYELFDDDEMSKAKNVLILEDDTDLAAVLKTGLEVKGYVVTIVSNGADGLKKILADEFSIILCDMVMPNFPGDMFYQAVERVRPQLCKKFIFMTGHQGDQKIGEFIQRIQGFILWKPFEMQVLFEAIKTVNSKQ
jgi:DNA-binding NtrC family response regulator